jgi:hypothetical protein
MSDILAGPVLPTFTLVEADHLQADFQVFLRVS